MKYIIHTDLLNGISLEEFLLLWAAAHKGTPANHLYTSLGTRKLGTPQFDSVGSAITKFIVNSDGKDFVNRVLANSLTYEDKRDLTGLAQALKDIFPKGKKDGTGTPWADGVALIEKRLKLFFKKYGDFPQEAIIEATKRYVEGFNGNYRLMRTLRYFIWKEERGAAGDVESKSDLLTYLENAGEEGNLRDDWNSTVV